MWPARVRRARFRRPIGEPYEAAIAGISAMAVQFAAARGRLPSAMHRLPDLLLWQE
jgi:hypothetical protein